MKTKYIGCDDAQVAWGSCNDPRGVLEEGELYEVVGKQRHSWHTKYILEGIEGKFNSVCFVDQPND